MGPDCRVGGPVPLGPAVQPCRLSQLPAAGFRAVHILNLVSRGLPVSAAKYKVCLIDPGIAPQHRGGGCGGPLYLLESAVQLCRRELFIFLGFRAVRVVLPGSGMFGALCSG